MKHLLTVLLISFLSAFTSADVLLPDRLPETVVVRVTGLLSNLFLWRIRV